MHTLRQPGALQTRSCSRFRGTLAQPRPSRRAFRPLAAAAIDAAPGSLSAADTSDEEVRVAWYERPSAFVLVDSLHELKCLLESDEDKHKVVEFFAGWCISCKAAFPALNKLEKDPEIKPHYKWYKANVENPEISAYIKQHQVASIPHMMVFNQEGKRVVGMSTSFKRVALVREGLKLIAKNPDVTRFIVNQEGHVAMP